MKLSNDRCRNNKSTTNIYQDIATQTKY